MGAAASGQPASPFAEPVIARQVFNFGVQMFNFGGQVFNFEEQVFNFSEQVFIFCVKHGLRLSFRAGRE